MKKLNELKKSKKGFTLIELIIVIAILGVLAAILVPSLVGTVANSRKQVNETNAQTLYSAAQASYVALVADGTTITEKKYNSTDSDAIITQIKSNLGNGFTKTWSVTVGANGITTVTYDTATFDGSTNTVTSSTVATSSN